MPGMRIYGISSKINSSGSDSSTTVIAMIITIAHEKRH